SLRRRESVERRCAAVEGGFVKGSEARRRGAGMETDMKGNVGRAFKVILGVLGASFFAAAMRRLLNFQGGGNLANAGVTIGSAVILFAGLKAFKWTQAANAVLVGGLI